MEILLTSLSNKPLELNQDVDFDLQKYHNEAIKDLKNVHINGILRINSCDTLEVNLTLEGVMTLSDSVTLNDINYPFTSKIEEEYDLNDQNFQEKYLKTQNVLDILEILWENIVLEVPIRLTKSVDAKMTGDGWSLGSIENRNTEIDPRLAELSKLLGEKEE